MYRINRLKPVWTLPIIRTLYWQLFKIPCTTPPFLDYLTSLNGSAVNEAAALSSLDTLETLLMAGAAVTAIDDTGWTALHYAAKRGRVDIAKRLLDYGAQIDAVDLVNATPLCLACALGSKDFAQFLLEHGAQVGIPDCDGVLPFKYALDLEHEDVAFLLLDHVPLEQTHMLNEGRYLHSVVRASSTKVDISILENERWTALHLASAYGVQEIVEALIGAGADVSCSHLESPTPPAMAAVNNHVPVIRLLRDHGADMDSGEFPPIWQAVMKGRQDAVEALLDLNASLIFICESTQKTLHDLAFKKQDAAIAMLLVTHGCFRAQAAMDSKTPQETRESTAPEESLAVVVFEDDEDKVAQFLSQRYSGSGAAELNEALRIASARGNQSLIEVLLDRRASLSSQDGNGRTALHYALSGMHIAVADVLVDRGANPLIEDNIGSTPLDLVVVHGMAAADFIHRHMGELTASISRRPSLLEAMGKQSSQAAPAIRKMISGTWTGFFEHLSWIKGTQQSFSISIPESDPNDTRQATFSSQLEHDEIGDFHFHGFVDQIGVVWFVKLYKRHGWLYRGQLNTDRRHMRGTWGSNRKLWFGTFELNLDA